MFCFLKGQEWGVIFNIRVLLLKGASGGSGYLIEGRLPDRACDSVSFSSLQTFNDPDECDLKEVL